MSRFRSSISYACLAPSSCQSFITFSSSSKTPLFFLILPKSFSLHAIIPISFYFFSPIMALIIRFQHVLSFILWLFLFSLLFHGWFAFKPNNQHHLSVPPNRKILATGGFDFSPFIHHRHHHRHRHHRHRSHLPDPKETEIDPRYGVEKRLVPTGPNPLHH